MYSTNGASPASVWRIISSSDKAILAHANGITAFTTSASNVASDSKMNTVMFIAGRGAVVITAPAMIVCASPTSVTVTVVSFGTTSNSWECGSRNCCAARSIRVDYLGRWQVWRSRN